VTSRRLSAPAGLRLDRSRAISFSFNGRGYSGFAGDTLASALLANAVQLIGRSFKLHRPRGIYSCGIEEPTGLVDIVVGAMRTPNVRATVLEILGQDFVGALAAKGLTRWPVIRHICKNAAPPVLALMGLQFGYLLGGSILVETVFNWPGSGNLLNLAIFRRDIPVLQATILVLATFFVVLNLVVDIAQAAIDPRIRYSR